jgi:hypothetical protein
MTTAGVRGDSCRSFIRRRRPLSAPARPGAGWNCEIRGPHGIVKRHGHEGADWFTPIDAVSAFVEKTSRYAVVATQADGPNLIPADPGMRVLLLHPLHCCQSRRLFRTTIGGHNKAFAPHDRALMVILVAVIATWKLTS